MNVIYDNQERDRMVEARESYSGRLLTDNQFDEAMAITGIMEQEIRKTGTFKQKLGDYSYAYARTEKRDAMKAEETIRDLFKMRTGQTMNQMRESLMEREAKIFGHDKRASSNDVTNDSIKTREPQLSEAGKDRAYGCATEVGRMIQEGDKMSFHRAYAHQASALAEELGITETGAKTLMKEQFELAENKSLYDWGKALEDNYYRPQIKAEQDARKATRVQSTDQERTPSRSRSRS